MKCSQVALFRVLYFYQKLLEEKYTRCLTLVLHNYYDSSMGCKSAFLDAIVLSCFLNLHHDTV